MKIKTFLAVALAATAALFSGCATNGVQPPSPAQIAAIACPQINVAVTQLKAFNTLLIASAATASFGAKANADIIAVQPKVNDVCNGALAATGVSAASIAAFVQTGLPALGTIVGSLPLPAAQQAQIQGALVLAETAVGVAGVVESQIAAAKLAAPAAASTAATPAK